MSANLDLIRSVCVNWERGDYSGALDWADPSIEFVVVDGPAPGSWSGVGGMREAWRELISTWEDYRIVIDELREVDGERVLILYRRRGRGKRSGIEVGQLASEGAFLMHVADGKVTRMVRYWDRGRALADLGLAPEGGSP